MRQTISFLNNASLAFPSPEDALKEPNGLLAIGGDLSAKRLIRAYQSGIFPWYSDGEPIMWWSPDPRAIINTADLTINRTLAKQLKRAPYTLSINTCFERVIALCADAPFRREDTWIVDDMQNAYQQLHRLGYAHSIEVWQQNELVGGLYGVAINGYFSGESMFYTKANASKFALVTLVNMLKNQGVTFIDCQLINPFLASMGCIEISREQFIEMKEEPLNTMLNKDFWQARFL